jgi:hypothetical protein
MAGTVVMIVILVLFPIVVALSGVVAAALGARRVRVPACAATSGPARKRAGARRAGGLTR